MIVYFADCLGDYQGDIPWETLRDCAKTRDFKSMPEPFSLKKEPPGQCSMQVFVVKKADGKHDILKMRRGTGLIWRYGNQFRVGRLAVQYMLKKVEGYQLRYHTVVAKPGKGASRKTAEWELKAAGYKFIREKGPRTNNANQFVEFAGRANAKGLTIWILTLRDFEPWFLNNVIKPLLASTLRAFGLAWIGKTRVGKSAGSKTLAFMMSRVEIEALEQSGDAEAGELVPTIVAAKHFHFFKAEPVTRVRPAIFDDGELSEQSASILKAFLNPSEEDATIWARWGSSEFDTVASRQVCNNAYDKLFER
ncbi:unnamed protein product, partial [Prorocentrum cordatum]